MKKMDIAVPKFVQKNDRYHLQVLASNLTDGNIKLFVQEGTLDNRKFKRYCLKDTLNNKIIEKYENIELAKSIINLSKKQWDFVSVQDKRMKI